MSVWKSSIGLVYSFHLALGKKEFVFPLMPNGACLGPNGLLRNGLSTYLEQPKGLEPVKDTWGKASHSIDYVLCIGQFLGKVIFPSLDATF